MWLSLWIETKILIRAIKWLLLLLRLTRHTHVRRKVWHRRILWSTSWVCSLHIELIHLTIWWIWIWHRLRLLNRWARIILLIKESRNHIIFLLTNRLKVILRKVRYFLFWLNCKHWLLLLRYIGKRIRCKATPLICLLLLTCCWVKRTISILFFLFWLDIVKTKIKKQVCIVTLLLRSLRLVLCYIFLLRSLRWHRISNI